METARWVRASYYDTLLTAWLQNECVHGYWVQFDPDSPYRLVESIQELPPELEWR